MLDHLCLLVSRQVAWKPAWKSSGAARLISCTMPRHACAQSRVGTERQRSRGAAIMAFHDRTLLRLGRASSGATGGCGVTDGQAQRPQRPGGPAQDAAHYLRLVGRPAHVVGVEPFGVWAIHSAPRHGLVSRL